MTEDDDRAARARQAGRPALPGQPGQAGRPALPGQPGQAGRPALPGDAARARGGSRGLDPHLARQRLARQIALSRRARRQRITLAVVGAMSAITLLLSGGAWMLTGYVSSLITRINAGTSGTPHERPGQHSGRRHRHARRPDATAGASVARRQRYRGELRHADAGAHPGKSSDRSGREPAARLLGQHPRPRHEQDQCRVRLRRPAAYGADGRAGHRPYHQRLRRGRFPRLHQGHRCAGRREHLRAVRGRRLLQRAAPIRGPPLTSTASPRWSSPGTGTRSPRPTSPGSPISSSYCRRCSPRRRRQACSPTQFGSSDSSPR